MFVTVKIELGISFVKFSLSDFRLVNCVEDFIDALESFRLFEPLLLRLQW